MGNVLQKSTFTHLTKNGGVRKKTWGPFIFVSYLCVCLRHVPKPNPALSVIPVQNCAQNVWNPLRYEFKPPVVIVLPLIYAALRPINRASLSKKKIKISNLRPKKDISKLFFPKKNISYLSRKKSFLEKS